LPSTTKNHYNKHVSWAIALMSMCRIYVVDVRVARLGNKEETFAYRRLFVVPSFTVQLYF